MSHVSQHKQPELVEEFSRLLCLEDKGTPDAMFEGAPCWMQYEDRVDDVLRVARAAGYAIVKEAALTSEREKLAGLVEAAETLVDDLGDLIANSAGVSGLHNNGDLAPWSELIEGGQYELWLKSIEGHRAAIAAAKGGV